MATAGGAALCLSGTALGIALSSLLDPEKRRPQRSIARESDGDYSGSEFSPLPEERSTLPFKTRQQKNQQRRGYMADHGAADELPDEAGGLNMLGGWEGFSMEDARMRNKEMGKKVKEQTPAEVLLALQRGNARFWTGCAVRPEKSAFERRALIMQQFPVTAVLGCADSRVPVEVIFDQGLGDMFVVRVAGNCLDLASKASLQYAVLHLKVKVLIVMGHEGCGAVKAAGLPLHQIEQEPEELATTLKAMKVGLAEDRLDSVHDARAHDREAVVTNARCQVERLCQDETIMAQIKAKELIVVGCFYEISSGIVDFFMQH